MVEPRVAERSEAFSGLRYLGWDDRGWHTLLVGPQAQPGAEEDGSRKIFRIAMQEKALELVQQEYEMRVHVNPDPAGPDEWVIRGMMMQVRSPQPQSRRSHIAKHGG